MTTSLKVAEYFGKKHYNVIRDIQSLDCSEKFNRLNFEAVGYRDRKGETRIAYEMNRDGFNRLNFEPVEIIGETDGAILHHPILCPSATPLVLHHRPQ